MAEEDVKEPDGFGPIDQDKLAAFIQRQTQDAFKASVDQQQYAQANQPQQTNQPATQNDPFADWLRPQLEPIRREANLQSASAMDESRFYRSSEWTNVKDLFDDDDKTPSEVKKDLDKLEKDIEDTFVTLARQGNPMPRAGILQLIMGEKLTKNRDEFVSKLGKKHAKIEERKVAKAKANADIGSATLASFGRDDILNLPDEKFDQLFTEMQF